jgi:hypothetical protein
MLTAMARHLGTILRPLRDTPAARPARMARSLAALVLLGGLLLPAAVAMAQAANPVAPPEPGPVRGGFPIWVAYVAMLALTAAVLAVGLLPSKRGHQD